MTYIEHKHAKFSPLREMLSPGDQAAALPALEVAGLAACMVRLKTFPIMTSRGPPPVSMGSESGNVMMELET